MIKISILYPNKPGSRFDMDYYLKTHMPMSIKKLGSAKGFQGVSVEQGVSGALHGSAPTYVAMCHYTFDTVQDFLAAFAPHAALLQDDIKNYTDIEPVIQASEVKISK